MSGPEGAAQGNDPKPSALRPKGSGRYSSAAASVLAMAEQLAMVRGIEVAVLLRRAAEGLERFEADLMRAGVLPSTILPARLAMGLCLDQKARTNRNIDIRAWAAGAQRMLFDGRDMSMAKLREFIHKAEAAGPDFDEVRGFLQDCLARSESGRTSLARGKSSGWGGITMVLIAGFALLVAGWAGYVEWRFHRDLTRLFDAQALDIGLDRTGTLPDLAKRLDELSAAAGLVARLAEKAPISLFARPLGFEARDHAQQVYLQAVQQHLPPALARDIDLALATQGEGLHLYDTLRAHAILVGQADWSAAYLAGWLSDRADILRDDQDLVPHIAVLNRPDRPLPQPDPELLAQAKVFAADTAEPDRAYLELIRSEAAAALPPWLADRAVPGLSAILIRKSGVAMTAPIGGIFSGAGWDYARASGAGVAVRVSRAEAFRLFGKDLPTLNDSADRVMDLLQRAQLATWKSYLADLRVRPFSDAAQSVLVSGRLSVPASPLEQLLREVWAQAGGLDRVRPHQQQIRVATEFAAMIQYVEQGRMREISSLFAALNVALGAVDKDEPRGLQRLMTVQDRSASVRALQRAPLEVVQIVEDVLVQSSASQTNSMTNALTSAWQQSVLPQCKALSAQFPFASGPGASLPDASLQQVAALLGPGGAIERFFQTRAAQFIDRQATPWRWKPDARFAGLSPDSAAFFETAQAIAAGFFATPQAELTLSALAERGTAFFVLGGSGGPVETAAEPLKVFWPGSDPGKGIEVSFTTPEGNATLSQPGEWGLIHMLDGLRLRERDDGRRVLVDLRSGGARLFLEIEMAAAANPLSRWRFLKGFTCPTTL